MRRPYFVLPCLIVGLSSCSKGDAPHTQMISFGGFDWIAKSPVTSGVLNPTWIYTNDAYSMQLIERREAPATHTDWQDFARFVELPLMTREMQVKNPDGDWVSHGLSITYYDDGSIGYSLDEVGQPVRDLGVKIPPQDWLWRQRE